MDFMQWHQYVNYIGRHTLYAYIQIVQRNPIARCFWYIVKPKN